MDRGAVSDDSDRDTPTPNQSGSYLGFAQMAKDLAARLETRSLVKRRVRVEVDIAGANRCDEIARELRVLASDFSLWPQLSAELVALSRAQQVPRLFDLNREAQELLSR